MLREMLVDGVVSAKAHLAPAEQAERLKHTLGLMEHLENEMAPISATWVNELLALPTLPDGMRAMFQEMVDPEHPISAIFQVIGWIGWVTGAIGAFGQITLRQSVYDLNRENVNVPLSPADAADAWMRGIITQSEANFAGGAAGVSPTVMALMRELVGEPPGLMDMLAAWRRGAISWTRFNTAALFSRLNDKYIETFKILAYETMSSADAVELAIKGVLSPTAAKAYFVQAGGLAEQWTDLYQGAGDAIGVQEAINLWNHGLISEAQVTEVIGRSRINPIFYTIAKLTRHHFLGNFEIHQAVVAGTITIQTATAWLIANGLTPAQAQAFAATGASGTVTKAKAETESIVTQLYAERVYTRTVALAALQSLGYPHTVATAILENTDAKQALSQRNAAVTVVKGAFLRGEYGTHTATVALTQLGIPATAITAWLGDWAVERAAKRPEFTTAQIGGFYKKGFLEGGKAEQMWQALGWNSTEVVLLLANYGGPAPPGSPAALAGTTAA